MRGPLGSLTAQLSKNQIKKRFPHRFLLSSGALRLLHAAYHSSPSVSPAAIISQPAGRQAVSFRMGGQGSPTDGAQRRDAIFSDSPGLSVRIMEQSQLAGNFPPKV